MFTLFLYLCLLNIFLIHIFYVSLFWIIHVIAHLCSWKLVLIVLNVKVSYHGKRQNSQNNVNLGRQTDVCAICEGYNKSQRFPHAVVCKRSFFMFGKENTVQCCNDIKMKYSKSKCSLFFTAG